MRDVFISNIPIGPGHRPFMIAEMSGNHNRSLEQALAIVDAAAKAGAHGLKIQTYTPDSITIDKHDGEFLINDPNSPWFGNSLYELYQKASTPYEWHEAIFERARKFGMVPFSTPFDATAVDFLETLDAPCYKIASFEIVHLPLIRKAAATGKPLIISTGMANEVEITEAVETARGAGCRDIILLHCVSAYPAPAKDSNLKTIPNMAAKFGVPVGLSDHTLGTAVGVAAVSLGACVIEKHLTLRREDGGPDAAFSLEPAELKQLCRDALIAWNALGQVTYARAESENGNAIFRRSLYVVEDLKEGALFTEVNVRCIRPGCGLAPKYLEQVLGARAARDIRRGTPLSFDMILD
jgi:N-acetylneuraminate synthase